MNTLWHFFSVSKCGHTYIGTSCHTPAIYHECVCVRVCVCLCTLKHPLPSDLHTADLFSTAETKLRFNSDTDIRCDENTSVHVSRVSSRSSRRQAAAGTQQTHPWSLKVLLRSSVFFLMLRWEGLFNLGENKQSRHCL